MSENKLALSWLQIVYVNIFMPLEKYLKKDRKTDAAPEECDAQLKTSDVVKVCCIRIRLSILSLKEDVHWCPVAPLASHTRWHGWVSEPWRRLQLGQKMKMRTKRFLVVLSSALSHAVVWWLLDVLHALETTLRSSNSRWENSTMRKLLSFFQERLAVSVTRRPKPPCGESNTRSFVSDPLTTICDECTKQRHGWIGHFVVVFACLCFVFSCLCLLLSCAVITW